MVAVVAAATPPGQVVMVGLAESVQAVAVVVVESLVVSVVLVVVVKLS